MKIERERGMFENIGARIMDPLQVLGRGSQRVIEVARDGISQLTREESGQLLFSRFETTLLAISTPVGGVTVGATVSFLLSHGQGIDPKFMLVGGVAGVIYGGIVWLIGMHEKEEPIDPSKRGAWARELDEAIREVRRRSGDDHPWYQEW